MKILRQEQITTIKSLADEAIKLKGIWEAIDGPIIQGGLTLGVNSIEKWEKDGQKVITDEVAQAIQDAVDDLLVGKYSDAIAVLEPIADEYINFAKLDDDTEAAMFGVVFFLLKTVVGYFEK